MPDNLLIYYSGHNSTVGDLIAHYTNEFRERIRRAGPGEGRWFLGIGPEYKSLLLAMLLLLPEDNPARKYVLDKLQVERLGVSVPGGNDTTEPVIRLVLERPEYAKDKRFDIEQNDESDRYWKADGIVRQFLDGLTHCEVRLSERFTIGEGYIGTEERYVLHLSLERFRREFGERGALWLFQQFDNLKTIGMLAEISVPLRLKGGADGNVQFFSDGQFQTIYIYAITELFKESNCLMLLDEPDAFLHPEWQYQFLKQVIQIREHTAPKNHLLMSSHSAITLIPHDREKIRFFDIKNNSVHCFEASKRYAIERLSAELIRYSEQEKLLSIFRTIQIKKKPVLFTEGTTDALILNEAWRRIYGEQEIPFIPFYAFSFTYIKQLLTDDRIYAEMGKLPVFSLFDFDEAFNAWKGLKGEVLQQDPFKGLIKKCEGRNAYAIMIPVPKNEAVMKQSIRNRATGATFGGASCCCIEHLFYGIPETAAYFEDEPCPGGSKVVFRSDSFKTKFAEEIVNTLPNACFKPLKPIFDFIAEKCVRRPAARGLGTARRRSGPGDIAAPSTRTRGVPA